LQTPQLQARQTIGLVRSRPVLNGLHHIYETSRIARPSFCRPTAATRP
jgi:hypothetical protein